MLYHPVFMLVSWAYLTIIYVMLYTKEQAYKEITDLVSSFRDNERSLANVPEAQIESNYIRKLFRFLNWNTENTGLSVPEWEFVLQRTDEKGRRPDYVLQLDGQQVLVMDAKKVKYDMHDPRWMMQVYAYAYSTQNQPNPRKIDFAILTDFQEFILLDCTLYTATHNAVSIFRILDWRYEDYVNQFDTLWEILERENVRAGIKTRGAENPSSLWARYLSPKKVKANRIPPDKTFLSVMDDENTGWRVRLAKDMKKHNPQADGPLLTAAVQLLIDRLIFVKALSDREIEADYLTQLAEKVEKSGLTADDAGWFNACRDIFARLNQFYNGSIFEPRPELEAVTVSNKVVRSVIHDLQPENSPYNFDVLPVEILGTIYERFLGRVVRTTDQRVKIEEKPEVRKAGGVYYTPKYIVDYIVENTVGKLLTDCKTPTDVAKLKIIDPACGSGSFLLGAYTALIRWHETYYSDKEQLSRRDREAAYYDSDGRVRLTARLKRQILLNNLYGVDIDAQAVEVTRFSLSLKALEDTRQAELYEERTLFRQTVLPDLRPNIKCGNSLIGPDYFTGQMFADPADLLRVNPFDWKAEFAQIIGAGGFDAVIGNPPYLFITELDQAQKDYFFKQYRTSEYRFDVYGLFIELSIHCLVKSGGYISFIIPHTLLSNDSFVKLRRLMLKDTFLEMVADIGPGVFQTTKNETMIFVARNGVQYQANGTTRVILTNAEIFPESTKEFFVPQSTWIDNTNATWLVKVSQDELVVVNKLERASLRLGKLCTINQGLRTGDNEKYLSEVQQSSQWEPAAGGKHIGRYQPIGSSLYVCYVPELLDAPRRREIFDSREKLIVQEIRNITLPRRLIATYDNQQIYCLQSTNVINLRSEVNNWDIKFLLGILNSNAANFFFRQRFSGNNHIASNQLAQVPVPLADKARHDRMIRLVESMLELHKAKAAAKTQAQQEQLQRQINATDHQIDALVYELYGLTDEEIKLVEGR
jgi:hypothetical protein